MTNIVKKWYNILIQNRGRAPIRGSPGSKGESDSARRRKPLPDRAPDGGTSSERNTMKTRFIIYLVGMMIWAAAPCLASGVLNPGILHQYVVADAPKTRRFEDPQMQRIDHNMAIRILTQLSKEVKSIPYSENTFDCEDFAALVVARARLGFYLTERTTRDKKAGYAIFVGIFRKYDDSQHHAAVFFLTTQGAFVLEPMTGEIFTLDAYQAKWTLINIVQNA